mgnify:FL=1
MSTEHISFRVKPIDHKWIQSNSKKFNTTQTEILSNLIGSARGKEAELFKDKVIQKGTKYGKGGSITKAEEDMLLKLGISTASGIAGYYIAGYIREQMELDENKGNQLLWGVIVGLGTQILQEVLSKKK